MDDSLRQTLLDLENRLLKPEIRKSATELDSLLAEEFVEFGISGRVYDKPATIAELAQEVPSNITISNFKATLLSPDIALVTYRALHQSGAGKPSVASLRSSIWKRSEGQWQMLFHQGTRAADS